MADRKRGREDAPIDIDPSMLLQAQHKAMHERIAQYKIQMSSLESELTSCNNTKAVLMDIVSLIGRQIAAVSVLFSFLLLCMCASNIPLLIASTNSVSLSQTFFPYPISASASSTLD